MFAVDRNVLVTADTKDELIEKLNFTLIHVSNWFQANRLVLNPVKTKVLKFSLTKLHGCLKSNICWSTFTWSENYKICRSATTQSNFLEMSRLLPTQKIEFCLFHYETIISHITIDSLTLIYFVHFQFIVTYGIIFWGNSPKLKHIFLLQKKPLRIMLGLACRSSCRTWFKKHNILTVPCLYIFSLAMFFIKHLSYFQTDLALHYINTRQGNYLHRPLVHHSAIQEGITYYAIKVFSKLPVCIRQFQYDKVQFKNSLNSIFLFILFIH
jgi:hypothetical protein